MDWWAILQVFKEYKLVFLYITTSVFLLFVSYLSITPPTHRALADFLPPGTTELEHLSINKLGLQNRTPDEIYFIFKKALASRTVQKRFLVSLFQEPDSQNIPVAYSSTEGDGFEDSGDFERKRINWQIFPPSSPSWWTSLYRSFATIEVFNDSQNRDTLTLSVESNIQGITEIISSQYPSYVNNLLVQELQAELSKRLEHRIHILRQEIQITRIVSEKINKDRIFFLQQAAGVAKRLDITEPSHGHWHVVNHITLPKSFYLDPRTSTPELPTQPTIKGVAFSRGSQNSPPRSLLHAKRQFNMSLEAFSNPISPKALERLDTIYLLGTRYLDTHIDSLRSRRNLDPYTPNIRRFLVELEWLKSLVHRSKTAKVFLPDHRTIGISVKVWPLPLPVIRLRTACGT